MTVLKEIRDSRSIPRERESKTRDEMQLGDDVSVMSRPWRGACWVSRRGDEGERRGD